MSSRKPGYLIGLALLAVILSAPQWVTCLAWARDSYLMLSSPLQSIFETWDLPVDSDPVTFSSAIWQGQYVDLDVGEWSSGKHAWRVTTLDLRTRQKQLVGEKVVGDLDLRPITYGDRLWFVSRNETYEFIDGTAQPTTLAVPYLHGDATKRFLLDGKPALFVDTSNGVQVQTFDKSAWTTSHELILPELKEVLSEDDLIPHNPESSRSASVTQCITNAGQVHLFLETEGWLMYRRGLELKPLVDEPVSALQTANQGPVRTPWTQVCNVAWAEDFNYHQCFGMLLNDQPIALMIKHHHDGCASGTFFRLNGTQWTQFATESFPFGVSWFRTVDSHDGNPALVVAGSSVWRSYVYDVDEAGVRSIPWKHPQGFTSLLLYRELVNFRAILVVTSLLGALLTAFVSHLMQQYTRADYEFGTQRVLLASLGRRGVARLLDIGLVCLSIIAVGQFLLRDMDWIAFVEANHLGVPHPTKQLLVRTAWGLLLWLVALGLGFLYIQGRWGLTPGKWCCRLRTVRTTLRPCGFARSLVREVVLWVDACGLLCWTSGVLSIALTDRRQRFGDLVADTIVVNASSVASVISVQAAK